MKVIELIEALKLMPQDNHVLLNSPYYGDLEISKVEMFKQAIFDENCRQIGVRDTVIFRDY